MAMHPRSSTVPIEDYLFGETKADTRHEYVAGTVHAMVGGTRRHNALGFRLGLLIGNAIQPPCQGYGPDMKIHIRVGEEDIFYYPDLSVSCREETGNSHYNEHPVLIAEVLSPSTERVDKHEKLLTYQRIDTLQEYLLVSQQTPALWLYRRRTGWAREVVESGPLLLESVGVTLTVETLYQNLPEH